MVYSNDAVYLLVLTAIIAINIAPSASYACGPGNCDCNTFASKKCYRGSTADGCTDKTGLGCCSSCCIAIIPLRNGIYYGPYYPNTKSGMYCPDKQLANPVDGYMLSDSGCNTAYCPTPGNYCLWPGTTQTRIKRTFTDKLTYFRRALNLALDNDNSDDKDRK